MLHCKHEAYSKGLPSKACALWQLTRSSLLCRQLTARRSSIMVGAAQKFSQCPVSQAWVRSLKAAGTPRRSHSKERPTCHLEFAFPSHIRLPFCSSVAYDDDDRTNVFSKIWQSDISHITQSSAVYALYRKRQRPIDEPNIAEQPVEPNTK